MAGEFCLETLLHAPFDCDRAILKTKMASGHTMQARLFQPRNSHFEDFTVRPEFVEVRSSFDKLRTNGHYGADKAILRVADFNQF